MTLRVDKHYPHRVMARTPIAARTFIKHREITPSSSSRRRYHYVWKSGKILISHKTLTKYFEIPDNVKEIKINFYRAPAYESYKIVKITDHSCKIDTGEKIIQAMASLRNFLRKLIKKHHLPLYIQVQYDEYPDETNKKNRSKMPILYGYPEPKFMRELIEYLGEDPSKFINFTDLPKYYSNILEDVVEYFENAKTDSALSVLVHMIRPWGLDRSRVEKIVENANYGNPSGKAYSLYRHHGSSLEWTKKVIENDKTGNSATQAYFLYSDGVVPIEWTKKVIENSNAENANHEAFRLLQRGAVDVSWVKKIIENTNYIANPLIAIQLLDEYGADIKWTVSIIEKYVSLYASYAALYVANKYPDYINWAKLIIDNVIRHGKDTDTKVSAAQSAYRIFCLDASQKQWTEYMIKLAKNGVSNLAVVMYIFGSSKEWAETVIKNDSEIYGDTEKKYLECISKSREEIADTFPAFQFMKHYNFVLL